MKHVLFEYLVQFYFTLGIPIIYLANLLTINIGNTMIIPNQARLLGLGLTLTGIIIWTISYLHLGHSFGVLPRSQTRLKNGIYSLFSHPMYLGISFTFIGLSIANQSQAGLIFSLGLTVPILFLRSIREESKLTS